MTDEITRACAAYDRPRRTLKSDNGEYVWGGTMQAGRGLTIKAGAKLPTNRSPSKPRSRRSKGAKNV